MWKQADSIKLGSDIILLSEARTSLWTHKEKSSRLCRGRLVNDMSHVRAMLSTSSWCFNLLCVKHLLPLLSQAHLCIPLWHLLISPLLLFLWNPISLASQYSKIYVHPPFFPSFHLVSFSPSAAALFNNPSILTSFHCFLEPCLLHNYLSFLASVSLSSLVTPLSIYPVVLQALHCKTQAHLACILFPLFNVGSIISVMDAHNLQSTVAKF